MINAHLVLVSRSVYTFDMSKTTVPERTVYRCVVVQETFVIE